MSFAASTSRIALHRALKPARYPASFGRAASTVVATPATPRGATNNLRNILSLTALVAGSTLFTVYYLDSRSAVHRYAFMPLVRLTMDPETGHRFAVKVLGSGLGPRDIGRDDGSLRVEVGLEYERNYCLTCVLILHRHNISFGAGRLQVLWAWPLDLTRMERRFKVSELYFALNREVILTLL